MSLPEDSRSDEAVPEDAVPENGRAPSDAWMDARVEAYVDDALPPAERAAFEGRLRETPRWRRAVRRARRLGRALRTVPQPDACPPEVTQVVLDRTVRAEKQPRPDRPSRARRQAPGAERPAAWQPALALTLLLVAAAGAALLGRPDAAQTPASGPPYTHAEVERAEAQAEWALALVADLTRETGRAVREDVLRARVAAPVQEALAAPDLDAPPPRADSLRSGR